MSTERSSVKRQIKQVYGGIARGEGEESCCPGGEDKTAGIQPSYEGMEGHEPEADLGLGCGIPLRPGELKGGETVLDLGSGAGNDCFVARQSVGPEGHVIGVDFSPEMIEKARENAHNLGYDNVEFREGDIEDLPVDSNSVDVVISNCVLNLVPDKQQAYREVKRVLKPRGFFSVSDVVLEDELPDFLRANRGLIAGCVGGAVPESEYMDLIEGIGFESIRIVDRRTVNFTRETLKRYVDGDQMNPLEDGSLDPEAIDALSLTVRGRKP